MAVYTLQNTHLQATFSPLGGEIRSLKNIADGYQYLWSGDPAVWSGIAPVLFPVVGRLAGDRFREGPNAYPHPKHGFLRGSTLSAEVISDTDIRFIMRSDPKTWWQYPFDFQITIGYRLEERTLVQYFEVQNTGPRGMVFALGAHPAFAIPMQADGVLTDYYLDFGGEEVAPVYGIAPGGLLSGETHPAPWRESRYIDITPTLFNDDALVFKELHSRSVTLRSRRHERTVKIDFADFPYLGVWAKPGAAYVCIEPWIGCADSGTDQIPFRRKDGVVELVGGGIFRAQFSITV